MMQVTQSKCACVFAAFVIVLFGIALVPQQSFAETITVGVLKTAAAQKAAIVRHARQFEQANPDITIKLIFHPDAEFKVALKSWLGAQQGPDVVSWQGGQRLYQLVNNGQVKDLTYLWQKNQFADRFRPAVANLVSIGKIRYGIPASYYQWGIYYRVSVFKDLGLTVPSTWEQFLTVCEKLKEAGITPITIGAKNKWPTAAWFDYLNLRINGLEYHQKLLKGEISFRDAGVKKVLSTWKMMLDKGYFTDRLNGWDWNQAMPFLYHKMAGMTLVGNFFSGAMPKSLKSDFRFFQFPIVNPDIGVYEEAPLDIFMVPNYVASRASIDRFLVSLASKEFQYQYNESIGMISPNMRANTSVDYFNQQGVKLLNNADGLSQFFDRDTNESMANAATAIFTDFMTHKNIAKTIDELEAAKSNYL